MFGNIINFVAIIIGTVVGLLLKHGLKEEIRATVMNALGLSVFFIGTAGALKGLSTPGAEPILFIVSIVLGSVIGELLKIENGLQFLGDSLQKKLSTVGGNISQGFVTASLIFCVGTMAIIGSLESGLKGNHDMLLAKSVLDGVASVILASTLGVGVIFSAFAVLVYQGSIVLFAKFLEPFMTADVLREISIVGGILIVSIGINILELKKIRTANMLPAVLIPPVYYFAFKPLMQFVLNLF